MNYFSFMIYISDFVQNLGILSILYLIAFGVAWIVISTTRYCDDKPYKPPPNKWFASAFIAGTLLAFLPSKQTVILITVSETAHEFIQSNDLVNPATQYVKTWIETQTLEMQKKNEKK